MPVDMNNLYNHDHNFVRQQKEGERKTVYVLLLTVTAMVAEIVAGTVFGSMALLADGWHMATHTVAFAIALFAYRFTQKHLTSGRYSFGPGKVNVLAGFASAIALGMVALVMIVESIHRLIGPQSIQFNEAILVAIIGLTVNLASMVLLKDGHGHHHGHDHDHDHDHGQSYQDHNLRAAYIHVLADTLTSFLAIIALLFGKFLGWFWLDAIMGIVGAVVILKWTLGLLRQTGPVLLDESIDVRYLDEIRSFLSNDAVVTDLHVWPISAEHYSAAISLEAVSTKTVEERKEQLMARFTKINHLTLEVHNAIK
jgi:cation diffusion facilitator family transporter